MELIGWLECLVSYGEDGPVAVGASTLSHAVEVAVSGLHYAARDK
jgi:hypothetical protein